MHIDVLFCALAAALSYADRSVFSVALVSMAPTYGWSLATQSQMLGAFYYGYVPFQLPSSVLLHRFGEHVVLYVACLLWSLFTALTPVASSHSATAVTVCRLLQGAAAAPVFPAVFVWLKNTVHASAHARAVTFVHAGNYVGVAAVLLAAPALTSIGGAGAPFYFFGSLGLLWSAGWHLCVPRPQAQVQSQNAPHARALRTCVRMLTTGSALVIFFCHFSLGVGQYVAISWLPQYFKQKWGLAAGDLAVTCLPYLCMAAAVFLAGRLGDYALGRGVSVQHVRKGFNSVGFFGGALTLMLVNFAPNLAVAQLGISLYLSLGTFCAVGYDTNKLDLCAPHDLGLFQGISQTLGNLSGIVGVALAAACGWDHLFFVIAVLFYVPAGLAYLVFAKTERADFGGLKTPPLPPT